MLIGLAIRSSIMLALGLVLSACLARRSAALRHRVLAGAMIAAGAVMPLSFALPDWNVTVPTHVVAARSLPAPVPSVKQLTSTVITPTAPARETVSPFVVAWLAGVIVVGGTLIVGLVRVSRMAARASRIEDGPWPEMLQKVAGRYGLNRTMAICVTDSADVLATWGFRRPHLLLPCHVLDWPPDRMHVVLCHELAHVQRGDWLVQIVAEALCAMLWFNPLAWMASTRLRRESEQACDDTVLGAGVSAREYAVHLLDLARQCRRIGSRWASAVPMAHPSTLERRIAAMLNPRLDRHAPSRRAVLTLGVVLLIVTLPVAVVRARQAGPAPLSGTIYDVTGGVLPGVDVTLVDANQIESVMTSGRSGRFEFPSVAPGTYVLQVAVPGFRTLRQEFELRDARDWTRAVTLQVGDVKETITVRESRMTPSGQQAPAQPGTRPLRVGGNIRAPLKVLDVHPVYPPSMREAGLTGTVPIEAIIGRDGAVSSVRVLSAQVHPDFAIAAVDAVRQWRFTPTLLNGLAVEVVMTVSVRFDLDE